MGTRNLPESKGQLECEANNLTAICEPIVWKMWEPRRLTTLWVSMAFYKDSFKFIPTHILLLDHSVEPNINEVCYVNSRKNHIPSKRPYLPTRFEQYYNPEDRGLNNHCHEHLVTNLLSLTSALCRIWGFHSGDWRTPSPGKCRRVGLVKSDVSEERIVSIFRGEDIRDRRKTLAVD
jgi:hypothetical protein